MAKVKTSNKKVFFKIRIAVVLILVIAILAVVLLIKSRVLFDEQGSFPSFEEIGLDRQNASEIVIGSGVTSIGMIQEVFPIEGLTEGLEVEKVLVESGVEIGTDTAIVKLTDSSVTTVREKLEKVLRDADLAYRSGLIEYGQAVIQAEATYQSTILNGEHAEAVYAENIEGLEENVKKAKEAYEEAKAELAEFDANLANGTYTSNLERWQREFDTNYEILVETMAAWGFRWEEVTAGRRGNQWGATEREQYLQGSQDMYDTLEIIRKYLTEAEEEYEEKVTNAEVYRQMLELKLPGLLEAYATAQINYETSLVQAKLTRETSLAEAELAQKNYETNLEKAESDLEALEEAYEDAKENLDKFEAQMGTGYYYPTETGTVLRVSVRAGREITSGSSLLMISNYDEMTVTVSVDQADIAKISVGDNAVIYSEDNGMAEGVVKSINPVSGSSGSSNVTYSVTVEMEETSQFGNNESVYVYFTVGGSDEEA